MSSSVIKAALKGSFYDMSSPVMAFGNVVHEIIECILNGTQYVYGNKTQLKVAPPPDGTRVFEVARFDDRATLEFIVPLLHDVLPDYNVPGARIEESIFISGGFWGSTSASAFSPHLRPLYEFLKQHNLPIKIRPDYYTDNVIVDWKTTSDADHTAFLYSVHKYGYEFSMALYQIGLEAVGVRVKELQWVVIPKSKGANTALIRFKVNDKDGFNRLGAHVGSYLGGPAWDVMYDFRQKMIKNNIVDKQFYT